MYEYYFRSATIVVLLNSWGSNLMFFSFLSVLSMVYNSCCFLFNFICSIRSSLALFIVALMTYALMGFCLHVNRLYPTPLALPSIFLLLPFFAFFRFLFSDMFSFECAVSILVIVFFFFLFFLFIYQIFLMRFRFYD